MTKAFIGRFQPFHKGHRKVIKNCIQGDLVIVIGSAGTSRTEENPLKASEREKIILECFPDIEIVYLEDDESDEEWLGELKAKTGAEVVISTNDRVGDIVKDDPELELENHDLYDPEIYSGQEVRRRIRSGEEWRYLVPGCAKEKIDELEDVFKDSGIQYEYEPGWKKENAYHGTSTD